MYTERDSKIGFSAGLKAPASELSERGASIEEYNPLSDNLNPGALNPTKNRFLNHVRYREETPGII